jgi:hypothetical protein
MNTAQTFPQPAHAQRAHVAECRSGRWRKPKCLSCPLMNPDIGISGPTTSIFYMIDGEHRARDAARNALPHAS